jgi:hypothetical protein
MRILWKRGNELILELPTKSMPYGFRAAAILRSLAKVRDRTGGAGGARACGERDQPHTAFASVRRSALRLLRRRAGRIRLSKNSPQNAAEA